MSERKNDDDKIKNNSNIVVVIRQGHMYNTHELQSIVSRGFYHSSTMEASQGICRRFNQMKSGRDVIHHSWPFI